MFEIKLWSSSIKDVYTLEFQARKMDKSDPSIMGPIHSQLHYLRKEDLTNPEIFSTRVATAVKNIWTRFYKEEE